MDSIESAPGVESVVAVSQPYKFVSKESQPEKTVLRLNGCSIGGPEFAVIAGPCSVESEQQILATAEAVQQAGATILRGGAFKPRTSPYRFSGPGRGKASSCSEKQRIRPDWPSAPR